MTAYLSFMAVASAALLVPGPDTFVVLRAALGGGARSGTWAAAGSATGLLAWGVATVVGVSALLTASAPAFAALKLAGVAFLAYLGAQALLAARRGDPLSGGDRGAEAGAAAAAFRQGLVSDLSNVKVALFWTALVPQFMDAGTSPALPLAMAASMAALNFAWLCGYAALAARLRPVLSRPRPSRAVNGVVGTLLVAVAAGLATTARG